MRRVRIHAVHFRHGMRIGGAVIFGGRRFGGKGEIRTHGTLASTAVFKTAALNHSATFPSKRLQPLGGPKIKNSLLAAASLGLGTGESRPRKQREWLEFTDWQRIGA